MPEVFLPLINGTVNFASVDQWSYAAGLPQPRNGVQVTGFEGADAMRRSVRVPTTAIIGWRAPPDFGIRRNALPLAVVPLDRQNEPDAIGMRRTITRFAPGARNVTLAASSLLTATSAPSSELRNSMQASAEPLPSATVPVGE